MNVACKTSKSLQRTAVPASWLWTARSVQHRNYTPPTIVGTSAEEIDSARSYCLNILRKYDAPAFTLQTFIPSHARDAYLAIRAFNVDIARIADATSNPTVGAMRMQFWRDAVTKALTFQPPKEPVAVLLSSAAARLSIITEGGSSMSKNWLHRIINMREKHLQNPPYPDLSAVESYAENTYSTLLYVTLSALPITSVNADHVASHVGKAQGIAALLRGIPIVAFPPPPNHHSNQASIDPQLMNSRTRGTVMLPLDVMSKTGLREEDVLRSGAEAKGLRDAVFEVATRANDHLITAREMIKNLRDGREAGHDFEHEDDMERRGGPEPHTSASQNQYADVEKSFGVFMPAVSTQLWLDKLEKYDFNPFEPKLRITDWKLPIKAYWSYSRRHF